jgi:hypothetical protein
MRRPLILVIALVVMGVLVAATAGGALADSLYIGDGSDNTVKSFDAQTGAPIS